MISAQGTIPEHKAIGIIDKIEDAGYWTTPEEGLGRSQR